MPDAKDKLKALRAQLGLKTGAEVAQGQFASPPAPQKVMPDSREMMRDLSARLGLRTGSQWAAERAEVESRRESGDFEVDKIIPGALIGGENGRFFLARHDYPLDHRQGNLELGEALRASSRHIAFSAADPELEDFDPRTALFMDTETTGLAGGTGTVAFLVGVGYFAEDCFRLDQCFMRDYDDEGPMLAFLDERFRACGTVVGYNSKCFDLPLMRTRFIQNRMRFRLETRPHYDLVHASRRFWKRRLSDCSLGNIEREVLGIRRHGDVPSYLIPQLWFDYLRTRDARPLESVFYHHRMDILSLVSLTAWLSQCLEAESGKGFEHSEDQLSLVRVHFNQKNYAEVVRHGSVYLESGGGGPMRRECLEMIGLAHKRLQQFTAMQEILELQVQEFPSDLSARLELAKLHEHRTRNLMEAARICEEALVRVPAGLDSDMLVDALRHRLERIRRKLGRAGAED